MVRRRFACIGMALALVCGAAAFSACGAEDKRYVESSLYPTVFFDDTGKGYVAERDRTTVIRPAEGVTVDAWSLRAVNAAGEAVEDTEQIARFDEATRTVTAVSAGTLYVDLCRGSKVLETVEVTSMGAYPSAPALTDLNDRGVNGSHDPSIVEKDGEYYVFTTGWETGGNQIRKSPDLMHWEYVGTTFDGFSEEVNWDKEFAEVCKALQCESIEQASFWAPDVVKCPQKKGYWLYTCAVYGSSYSRACIFLCCSKDLTPGSFRYEGILFQSNMPAGGANKYINAIDPQIIFDADGKMYMAYGSFNGGLYLSELDPKTGLKAAGMNEVYDDDTVHAFNDERKEAGSEGAAYCGTEIATGSMEGPVIARHDGVGIYNDDGTLERALDSRYFLMTSYGELARTYNMRYAVSDTGAAGKYLDWRGDALNGVERSGYKAMGAYCFTYADGSQMSAEVGGEKQPYNVYAPGHNDLFTTERGIHVLSRINRFSDVDAMGGDFCLFVNQYYLNSRGQIVVNPNRYAGERLRTVSAEEFAQASGGNYQFVLSVASTSASAPVASVGVALTFDGASGGTFTADGTEYAWTVFGEHFIKIVSEADTYYGVLSPAWLEGQERGGLTVTAMGQDTGMSLYLNADYTAE